MAETKMPTLKDIGEVSAIERLQKYLPAQADVVSGAGDDCAVVKTGENASYDWLLTSDPVIEGTHFTGETPPSAVGHKAVARVLSDLAAMGGEPKWALIDIVAPPETPISRLEECYSGASRLADKYGLALVGGDISRGNAFELHVFAIGRVPTGSALLRSGAEPDEAIYVTGSLGASSTGRHLSFEPRVSEGIWLREGSWATALIDVSDGLARDLGHLTDMSKTGAELYLSQIPVSQEALKINNTITSLKHAYEVDTLCKVCPCLKNNNNTISPLEHALYDGEDFELLFTVPRKKEKAFMSSWNNAFDLPCTLIGHITKRHGVIECVDENGKRTKLEKREYEHFI